MFLKVYQTYGFRQLLFVWIAIVGMGFVSIGPTVFAGLLSDMVLLVEIDNNEGEEDPNETNGGGNSRILEEETKHLFEVDFSRWGFVAGNRHMVLTMHESDPNSQHLPSILIPPPERHYVQL